MLLMFRYANICIRVKNNEVCVHTTSLYSTHKISVKNLETTSRGENFTLYTLFYLSILKNLLPVRKYSDCKANMEYLFIHMAANYLIYQDNNRQKKGTKSCMS